MIGGADLPTQLNEDLQDLVPEAKWDEAYRIVHAIIGDVLDSVGLAICEADDTDRQTLAHNVKLTVEDYVANNYGDEHVATPIYPPGWAPKAPLAGKIAHVDPRPFEHLLDRFTPPNEVFGPVPLPEEDS